MKTYNRMKRIFLVIAVMMLTVQSTLDAQTITNLWITGSAVPGGVQKLTKFPGNKYKYAGTLQKGEVYVMSTESEGTDTYYLRPRRVDSYIVNHGLPFTFGKTAGDAGWVVTFDEDRYRFTVDLDNALLKGELFQPWDELFIVGGCISCGWEGHYFLPFTRDENELCSWTWIGEMKERPENVEPRRFKIMGQNAWAPKSLHPFKQDENINGSTQVCTGGADNKWDFGKAGFYMLKVDVFRETISSTYLGETYNPAKLIKK